MTTTNLPPLSKELLCKWHKAIESKDDALLMSLIDDNCTFRTPIYYKERKGKQVVAVMLKAALQNFGPDFRYLREYFAGEDFLEWVLHFESTIGGKNIRGVDIMKWSKEGKLLDMEVCLRPIKQAEQFGEMQRASIGEIVKKLGVPGASTEEIVKKLGVPGASTEEIVKKVPMAVGKQSKL